jgi:two-component system phosphate regulon sensor histidine kinase PhoR
LLNNAIKYNREKGKVMIGLDRNEDLIELSIQDTGRGIPEEALPNIFERFYRVPALEGETPGTGLGLAIAHRIIKNHGGTIDVESTLGKGSTFTLKLPASGTN